MGFETTPFQKLEFKVTISNDKSYVTVVDGRPSLEFNKSDGPLLMAIAAAPTLKDTVLSLRQQNVPFRVSRLLRLVLLLCEEKVILNEGEFLERLYHLKGQTHAWSWPLIKRPFLSYKLSKYAASGTLPDSFGWLLMLGILLAATLAFEPLSFTSHFPTLFPLQALIWFWVANSLAMQITGVFELVFLKYFWGVQPETHFRVSAFGAFLQPRRWVSLDGRRELLASHLQVTFLVLHAALYLISLDFLPIDPVIRVPLATLVIPILLVEMTPISKSRLAEALRFLFHSNLLVFSRVKTFDKVYLAVISLWTLFAVIFITQNISPLYTFIQTAPVTSLVSVTVMGLFFLLTLGIDIVKCVDHFISCTPVESVFRSQKKRSEFNILNVGIASDIDQVFEQVPLLKHLPENLRGRLREKSQFIEAPKGTRLCTQGQVDRSMFVLTDGRVGVTRRHVGGEQFITALEPGAIFGEVGLFKGEPRTANVRALTDSRLLWIRFDASKGHLALDDQRFAFLQNRIWLHQSLISSDLFSDLPLETIDQILASGEIKDAPANMNITEQGKVEKTFYILIEGKADVYVDQKKVRTLSKGAAFGEIALFENSPRTATVRTKSPAKLFCLDEENFWHLMSSHLGLAVSIERLRKEYVRSAVN